MISPALEILVVEQEPPVATAIRGALRRRGHHVSLAANTEEALGFPAPQVLVADVQLGEQSGLEVLETLVRRGTRFHAVMLSDAPSVEDCRRAMRLGATEFLAKPFQLAELVEAVEAAPPPPALPVERVALNFERRVLTTPGNITTCLRELTAFLMRMGLGPSLRARTATACAELLDNARRHAYADGVGNVRVEAHMNKTDLVLGVTDEGCGYDTLAVATGNGPAAHGGGLVRAAALSEDLRVESVAERGTRVTLRFAAFATEFQEANVIDLAELDYLTPEVARRLINELGEPDQETAFNLSPALAVTVGRLLSGPAHEQSAQQALWS